MDDIKLFAKIEKERERLIQTIIIYSPYIGMELGNADNEKRGKRIRGKIEQPNQECIWTLGEKQNEMYLRILEVNRLKTVEMKKTIRKMHQKEETYRN